VSGQPIELIVRDARILRNGGPADVASPIRAALATVFGGQAG